MHFCTYFDSYYLHRGLALYFSLEKHLKEPFTLWILCFDSKTYTILKTLNLKNVKLIEQEDFESEDTELLRAKGNRTRVEYYWTCTPSLPLYIFRNNPAIKTIYYLDADTFFFSSPNALDYELRQHSILIVPHDYSKEFEEHSASGIYNVGIMAFRRDANGMDCLKWWRERCIEWCYWRHEDGKIGDQAYLNDWPVRFENVVVSGNIGINAAPWNVAKYGIESDWNGSVLIGKKPLVCFHFHGFGICSSNLAFFTGFNVNLPTSMLSIIYRPYIESLIEAEQLLFEYQFEIKIPKVGFPWRYIAGRLIRRQPMRHFMWIKQSGFQ